MRVRHFALLSLLAASASTYAVASPPELAATTAFDEAVAKPFYVVLEGDAIGDVVLSGQGDRAAVRARIARQHAALEAELATLGVRPVARLKNLVNAVQVLAAPSQVARIERLAGVVRVEPVPTYVRHNASAVPFVGAYKAWSQASVHGEGIRIGIIDTGIDYLHADFGGPGTPEAYSDNDPTIIEPGTFPTTKVIGGVDFVGDKYDPSGGKAVPVPDDDPLDCAGLQAMVITGGHGTHVSGTAAGQGVLADGKTFNGPYDQSVSPSAFRVGPGVAPAAKLFALKVFGCEGSTNMVAAALDRAADPNDDGDTSDRLDVINMSLGGSYGLVTQTDQKLIRTLTGLGTFVAVAAGNDGDAFFVTGAPATYDEALSVAATTDSVSFVTLTVDSPAGIAGDYPASEGAFTKPLITTGAVKGTLAASSPANGCTAFTNGAAVAGKIAFIQRGSCTFVNKVKNAVDAGAIAVVIADNQDSDVPFSPSGNGGQKASIPGVMIRKVHGDAISGALSSGVTVTIDATKLFPSTIGADEFAGFTSRGPRAPDLTLKPEIAAPGVAIDSAGVSSGTDPRQLQGTSMACPVVAGAAALLRQARPNATTATMKALLMNTAGPVTDEDKNPSPVSITGAGRLRIDEAVKRTTFAHVVGRDSEVAVSFGGLVVSQPTQKTLDIEVENFGTTSATYDLAVKPTRELPGVTVKVSPSNVVVPAGGKVAVTLELAVDPVALGAPGPDASTPVMTNQQARHFLVEAGGHLTLTGAAGDLVLPYHGVVRAAAERSVTPLGCIDGGATIDLEVTGASAHPNPATSVFALGATSPKKSASDTDPVVASIDILATGAATNLPTAESFDKASVYFAVAVAGPWATPALGQLNPVIIEIDTNGDDKPDFEVHPEALSKDYFGDVLTATTYVPATQMPTPSRRFLNVVSVATLDTQAFLNDVVIFPVTLKDLGLTPGKAKISYRAATAGISKAGETSAFTAFDIENPGVQPIGGLNGSGLYPSTTKPSAKVAAGQKLLVLHHTNIPGKRFEIVAPASSGNLAVTGVTTDADATFTVTNTDGDARTSVKVTVTASSGTLGDVTVDGDACPKGDCQIAELAKGAKATIVAKASAKATLQATVSVPGCEPKKDDDTVQVTLGMTGAGGASGAAGASGAGGKSGASGKGTAASPTAAAPVPDGPYAASGGCDCATGGATRDAGGLVLGLAGLAALGVRRRRPVRV